MQQVPVDGGKSTGCTWHPFSFGLLHVSKEMVTSCFSGQHRCNLTWPSPSYLGAGGFTEDSGRAFELTWMPWLPAPSFTCEALEYVEREEVGAGGIGLLR